MTPHPLRRATALAVIAGASVIGATLTAAPALAADPEPTWLGSDFSNVGIGDRGSATANLDGGGGWFIRDLLPGAGLPSGHTLDLATDADMHFVLGGATEGAPDNVVANGQTLDTSIGLGSGAATSATRIAFVGAATSATQQNQPLTLRYSDGTEQQIAVTLTDWCSGSGTDGNVRQGAVTNRWYAGKEDTGTQCGLWTTATYPLAAGKALDAIMLPVDSRFHLFAIASDAVAGSSELTAQSAPQIAAGDGDADATTIAYGTGALGLTAGVSWAATGVTTSYQWFADDAPIANATSQAYEPRLGDIGATLTLVATGRKSGYAEPGTSASRGVLVQPGTLIVTRQPAITGTARVGDELTVSPGAYSAHDVDEAYQWLADGDPIADATGSTFTPTTDQLGARLSVAVTATRAGYDDLSVTTAETDAVAAAIPPALGIAAKPVITGTVRVGATLHATATQFTPSGARITYQWLRGGVAIPGATSSIHGLVAADRGHTIRVIATGTLDGYSPTTTGSASTAPVAYGVISLSTKGSIAGTAKVGSLLTLTKPKPATSGTTIAVQWYRDGSAIAHATATTYRPTSADRGHTLSAHVTVSKAGYTTVRTSISTAKVQ